MHSQFIQCTSFNNSVKGHSTTPCIHFEGTAVYIYSQQNKPIKCQNKIQLLLTSSSFFEWMNLTGISIIFSQVKTLQFMSLLVGGAKSKSLRMSDVLEKFFFIDSLVKDFASSTTSRLFLRAFRTVPGVK